MPYNENTSLLHNGYQYQQQQPFSGNGHYIEVDNGQKSFNNYEAIAPCYFVYRRSLTLAELLPYQDCPFWRRVRLVFLAMFWITVLGALLLACLISYTHRNECNILKIATTTSLPLSTSLKLTSLDTGTEKYTAEP